MLNSVYDYTTSHSHHTIFFIFSGIWNYWILSLYCDSFDDHWYVIVPNFYFTLFILHYFIKDDMEHIFIWLSAASLIRYLLKCLTFSNYANIIFPLFYWRRTKLLITGEPNYIFSSISDKLVFISKIWLSWISVLF